MENTKKASELIFISKIKQDGLGISILNKTERETLCNDPWDKYQIHCLSITEETYIAHGFTSYVVKLKQS